ncbi:hypothetical protein ACFQ1M_09890 [Sungkyunkwania multivorans]|uniref:Uncharacterized protein n=1 Tax=Sungkyunkwania multivorans TaxID=1173618 RepID=A0ABW3D062_9FLAO
MSKDINEILTAQYSTSLPWSTLAFLGKNKIINRTYIYLFLVPAIAKFLSQIESPLKIALNDYLFVLVIELPFSWKLFFLCALLFTAGSILFNLFCPQIIKENVSFSDFRDSGKDASHLESYGENVGIDYKFYFERKGLKDYHQHIEEFNSRLALSFIKNHPFLETFHKLPFIEQPKIVIFNQIQWLMSRTESYTEQDVKLVFWELHKYANFHFNRIKIAIFILYFLGLICLGIVILQGAYAVWAL